MSRKIYKYVVPITDSVDVEMPAGSTIISAERGETHGQDCFFVWAIVPERPTMVVRYRFYVVGTGNDLPDYVKAANHIRTEKMGNFVWHLFSGGVLV